jgi:multimeric flavodoxin WrbA
MGKMRVLLINGSPRVKGNTSIALAEVAKVLEAEGVETTMVHIGVEPVRGCVACGACRKSNSRCAFSDALYDKLRAILEEGIDGLVVGSPVYYAGPNGSLCALLDRLFYSSGALLAYKPAAAVAVCRRGGASATFDRLNKYFTINNMPVVPSQYWNSVHGAAAGEALEDLEGLQTMRTLGRNMVWMLRDLQREDVPAGEEKKIKTSFVR